MKSPERNNRLLLLQLITGRLPKKNPQLDETKKYVFIISTGRTGTTYIANYLANYENVYAVHEPKPSWRMRMWSVASLENNVDDDYLYRIFVHLRKKRIAKVSEKIYVESNPSLKGFSLAIAKNIPNSYIIHIIRDPRDSIVSGVNHGALRFTKRLMISLIPYWHLHPLKLLGQKQSVIKKIARSWVLTNKHIERSEAYTNNYLQIKFEDLFKGENKMKELVEFLGIEQTFIEEADIKSSDKNKNASKHRDLQGWKSWSPSFANKIYAIVGKSMEKYGYGHEKEWRKLVERR